jgi:predicted transcriptional regulator
MVARSDINSLSLTEQVVLCAVAEAHRSENLPAQTHEIRRSCRERLAGIETDVVGTITEADVMRSLYRLEAEGFVEEREPSERSPAGKGRPAYELGVDVETIYEGVSDQLL